MTDEVKERRLVQGLPVAIEWRAGEMRQYTSGHSRLMLADYGFIEGVDGVDGEALDCYVGRDLSAPTAVIVEQLREDGSFDELKIMLGFGGADSKLALEAAVHVYQFQWCDRPWMLGRVWGLPNWLLPSLLRPMAAAPEILVKALDPLAALINPGPTPAAWVQAPIAMPPEGNWNIDTDMLGVRAVLGYTRTRPPGDIGPDQRRPELQDYNLDRPRVAAEYSQLWQDYLPDLSPEVWAMAVLVMEDAIRNASVVVVPDSAKALPRDWPAEADYFPALVRRPDGTEY